MIDYEKLKPLLEVYKISFPIHWEEEKYKWEAVKHFQDYWDIEAENFGEMFKQATDTKKTITLLVSGYTYPKYMIEKFAEADDGGTRTMFRDLFDESVDLADRVNAFQEAAENMRKKYDDGTWKNHYQNTNAISTYLWLRYPDKYYIYKYLLYDAAATMLSSDYKPKANGSVDSMISGFRMYDEICEAIAADPDITKMVKNVLTTTCYSDPKMKTATIDFGFHLANYYLEVTPAIWKISHGSVPKKIRTKFEKRKVVAMDSETGAKGISKVTQGQCFMEQIKAGDYFYLCYGNIIKLFGQFIDDSAKPNKEMGGKWYERKYELILKSKEGVPYDGVHKWWSPNDNSTCVKIESEDWPLFEKEILNPFFGITLEKTYPDDNNDLKGYWWLTANPKIWSFADIRIGEEQSYTLYNENGNKRRIFQNFLDAKAGDIVIGYEANPVKRVVAIGCITRESDGESICFKKVEGLTNPIDYRTLKESPELEKMEFFVQPNGSLFKLTKGEFDFIMDMIREDNPLEKSVTEIQKYSMKDFLSEVFLTEKDYNRLTALLRNKMNVILQGAPGVGKTFTAKRLAYAMMGEVDDSRIEMVQFHQNYSYEDFILGYRPDGAEFKLTEGIFYRFCQTAANHPDKEYFFIIDEINRGNLSKIFGELLMLIEKDYRGVRATLAYTGMPFFVPENLYIIGMMNTADRSLAMIDYALRRRFSFFEMQPGFDSDGFEKYRKAFANKTFDALIDQIEQLNREITDDRSLGRGFQIGHSYFCGCDVSECTDEWMRSVVDFDILPMLSEYWFDEPAKLQHWEENLSGVFND